MSIAITSLLSREWLIVIIEWDEVSNAYVIKQVSSHSSLLDIM